MDNHLYELLAIDNSKIAKFVGLALESLLEKAQKEFPQDPGTEICDAVLQEVRNLRQPYPAASATNQSQNEVIMPQEDLSLEDTQESTSAPSIPSNLTPTDESNTDKFKLWHLKENFESDPELRRYLGDFQLTSQTDSDLWNEIQCKLLRIPKNMASSWRKRALELAQEAGSKEDASNRDQLPFKDNEDIYSGLKGSVRAKGLCLSKEAPLKPEVLLESKSEDFSEDLYLLASLVSICITFINLEPDLHHALETVYKFDTISLHSKPEQRKKYITALTQRFGHTLKAEKNADEEPLSFLKAWIAVDEAIHSLVFIPPVDSDSWWGELNKRSRRILRKIAQKAQDQGHDVRIRELSGLYADIRSSSSKDYDLPLKVGGIPGEVQACLRVYARINNEGFPGRVIYRLFQ
ncbi:MAG: hypothetical protein AAF378_00990 [Cyanobacteria bacterium P01_A01_bin.84]